MTTNGDVKSRCSSAYSSNNLVLIMTDYAKYYCNSAQTMINLYTHTRIHYTLKIKELVIAP